MDSTNPLAGLDLRVGHIVEVSDHPNADKLYVMKIDLGDEQRQLVAGMKPYYPVDELSGKKMIMVCNLKPAKLRGVKSMGMLLAADDGEGAVVLLTPEKDVEPGTLIDGCEKGAGQIEFPEFLKYTLLVQNKDGTRRAMAGEGDKSTIMKTTGGVEITTDKDIADGSAIH